MDRSLPVCWQWDIHGYTIAFTEKTEHFSPSMFGHELMGKKDDNCQTTGFWMIIIQTFEEVVPALLWQVQS